MHARTTIIALALGLFFVTGLRAGDVLPAWTKHDKAVMGPTRPVAFVYAPTLGRWMSLGYQFPPGSGPRKLKTYDDLAYDPVEGQWENWYPLGKNWGPKFGDCNAPPWKGEAKRFTDVEGNVRPNWMGWYWLLGAGRNYTWDPDTQRFLFYMDGTTFSYDPKARAWQDLAAKGDPQSTLKSRTLLWGSICYDQENKRVVLFGGGNAETERGDPGTWTYTPATSTWAQLDLAVQPPARANSSLVYDPVNKKVVLFGGDQLNQLIADTWVFDGKQWEQRKPAVSPAPRAGHVLLWLPKAQKILLVGGYSYTSSTEYVSAIYRTLPMELWTYDVSADSWDLIQRIEPGKKGEVLKGPLSPNNRFVHAAVDSDERVGVVDVNRTLWTIELGKLTANKAGTAEHGVKPGTIVRRGGPYDPTWYHDGLPPADPAKVEADLKTLAPNRWHRRPTPKLPKPNTDWGSAVFATYSDQIIRFSGGHSAYSGTAPHVYDVKTDRWSLPFAPEMPIEFCYSNDGVPGEWSFAGNPWMTGHTYKSTGYDPNLKCLVFGPHKKTFFFDPQTSKWTRAEQPNPYRCDFYTVTLIPTPKGLVAWTHGGPLWRLDPKDKSWTALPLKGKFPTPIVDNAGMAYDSKRDRLLAFARFDKTGVTMHAYDFATGEASVVDAAGNGQVQTSYRGLEEKRNLEFREAVYLADADKVLIAASGMIYDCAKNAWFRADIPSDSPDVRKHPIYNLGVMFDPQRNLVWAVDTNSNVFVLRIDHATLKLDAVP